MTRLAATTSRGRSSTNRASAVSRSTAHPPARRRQPGRRRDQRNVEPRAGAPRAGTLRSPGPPATAPVPSLCALCRAALSARQPSPNPPPCCRTRPRSPRPVDLTASVLLVRSPRPHSGRSAGGRAGRHFAATEASFRSGLQPPSASPWVPPRRLRERLYRAGWSDRPVSN